LGLRPDCLLLDLVGQGCGAALPNLRTAEALLASGRADRVLSVCVEVCSAAFFLDDDPGVLVSACLFGDGAAAAVLTREPNPDKRRIVWKAGWTRLSAVDRDHLRFEQQNGLLRNILAKQVPELAAEHVERVLQTGLAEQNLSSEQIAAWIFHSGGKAILSAVRDRLRLPDSALDWSARVLREYGNLSSPCVLFVLDAALAGNAPKGWWWMSSFGAGFSSHAALLEVS
jgi:alkylresorcinol/alkylpyrone synthase